MIKYEARAEKESYKDDGAGHQNDKTLANHVRHFYRYVCRVRF